MKVITDFARRTGDLGVLSRPDIHVLALAYELECERNGGDWRLRSVPGQQHLNGDPPTKVEGKSEEVEKTIPSAETKEASPDVDSTSAPVPAPVPTRSAWSTQTPAPVSTDQGDKAPTPAESNKKEDSLAAKGEAPGPALIVEDAESHTTGETVEENGDSRPTDADTILPEASSTSLEESLENTYLDSESQEVVEASSEPTIPESTTEEVDTPEDNTFEEVQESSSDSESSDDGGEWITPSNIKKHQQKDSNTTIDEVEKTLEVATLTSDYAMQNVLLRMNLNLLSPKLMRIRELKSWVLRCHACFHIEKDTSKQFCQRCGKPSLMRTSCSTDKDGNFRVHLKNKMQWSTRGNVYSIPKPVAGTSNGKLVNGGGKGGWGQGLILAEDQKEYVHAMTGQRRRKEKNLMDEDYLPSILTGDRGGGGGKPKVGAGRNVNSKKRNKK